MKAYVKFTEWSKELTIDEAVEEFRQRLLSHAKIAMSREKRRLEIGGIRAENGTKLRFWVGAK